MEIILYITGGVALLALAWLFLAAARAISGIKDLVSEARTDVHTVVVAAEEVKEKILPILGNVTNITDNVTTITGNVSTITGNVSTITDGVRGQMVGVQKTIDDALDVVRGTLDNIERLKNEVVATVEGPVMLVRDTSGGLVSTAFKAISAIAKLVKSVKHPSMNGHAERT